MSKGTWIFLGAIALIAIVFFSTYQGLIGADENVAEAWGNVEVQYQARADKTKGLVEIVKGAAQYESETLREVIEARSKAVSIQLEPKELTEENLRRFEEAQSRLSGALSRLLIEQYPQLQAVAAFRDFQAQYEGMENRISVARKDYNEAAKKLNTKIRGIPGSWVNNWFGLGIEKKAYFQAAEGSDKAPEFDLTK